MLSSIFSGLVGGFIDSFLGRAEQAWEAYVKKEISRDELMTRLREAALAAWADVEKAHADSIAKTFDSFMRAAAQNAEMARAWAIVVYSQLAVLLWHQAGIPVVTLLVRCGSPHWSYPSSGATVDWAYLLLALCLGGGAVLLRTGPGTGSIADRVRNIIAK